MRTVVRLARILGPVLLAAGGAALAWGFMQGEASLHLFLVFPVITATGGWSALGILLIIAGFFALFLTWSPEFPSGIAAPMAPSPASPPTELAPSAPTRRWGGVVFLGPVPVVFGSDAKVTKWMIVVGVLLFVGLVVLTVISLRGI